MATVIAFWLIYGILLVCLHLVLGEDSLSLTLAVGSNVPLWVLTLGAGDYGATVQEYVETVEHPVLYGTGLLIAYGASVLVSLYAGYLASKPRTSQFHMRGLQLRRGEEAREAARRISARENALESPYSVALSDDLVLGKKTLSRHVLISGSVGAGKTVILHQFISAFVHHRTAKALIYDIKGDFTACYPYCAIVGVEDERGRSIPLGKVIRTKKHAAIFMQSIIPDTEGSSGNKFFDSTARLVGVGAIMTLVHTMGQKWGAHELAEMMNKQAPELSLLFEEHYAKAAQALGDPKAKTATDIMATVASYTRIFDELDVAWGPYLYDKDLQIRRHKDGKPLRRKEWNPMAWIKDEGYDDKRCVILQGSGDKQINKGYISAIINLITPEIVSPALPDNEQGRCLAFVLDEMATIGRIADFELLAVAGRSKGVVMVMAYQDIAQLKSLYGQEMTSTIESTVYTKIICEQQMGDTRDHIAKAFSTKIIASVSHTDGRVHEEGKPVVYPDELTTELGRCVGAEYGPEGWGINFIAAIGGNDPMILTCPGKTRPIHQPGRVPGAWTHVDFERVAQARVQSVMEQNTTEEQNRGARKEWAREQPAYKHTARKMLGLNEDETEALIEGIRPDTIKPIVVPPYGGLIRTEY